MSTTYDELTQFDRDFNPSPGGVRRPGLEALSDGTYDFEIISSELTRTEKSNELIFRLGLRVQSTGLVVEHAYFFRTQQNVDILGSDLCTLGLDADQWHPPQRPLSRELPAAAPRLKGVRFRGKKATAPNKADPAKPYHNLYVNQRLDGTAAPAAASPPPSYSPDLFAGHQPAGVTAEDIPF